MVPRSPRSRWPTRSSAGRWAWCAQTPQAFRREWIEAAHAAAAHHATDDAALVEALGHRVHLTPGDPLNFKVTTPHDLELAEAWLTRTSART
jgi:2-C-methyl-D-erythritol 4-phosphate cytidylyltransferase